MIDFHCHLDLYDEPARVVSECVDRDIYVLGVTTAPTAWAAASSLAGNERRIRTALGLHPQLAGKRKGELALFDRLLPEVRYVGEVGLDGSQEFTHSWQDQVAVFEHVLGSCQSAGGRIMSIHSRRAAAAVLDRVEQYPGAGIPVLHWYSGNRRELRRAIDLNCWFSVGPSMALSKNGLTSIGLMPRERVLTESDGPFLTIGDRTAFPWDVELVVAKLAEVWSAPRSAVHAQLLSNLRSLVQQVPAGL